jgi:hypothetical protein
MCCDITAAFHTGSSGSKEKIAIRAAKKGIGQVAFMQSTREPGAFNLDRCNPISWY